ncbi:sodium-dependent noradrenaline transporter-like [Cydia pomonella]|uniref:sodium-dependent noradrenaline transporter-like n=1 Tax=Cydia pomonella TaxID=82600 RepID=UPI002ADD5B61|nr:sodium-dependent noradrenaline transporter-like [Cydia pomonella]
MFARSKNDSYMGKRNEHQSKSKFWKTYSDYRLILWMWMLGDTAVMWAPAELAHNGFYLHSIMYLLVIIVVATPLLFSEICLAQYTNCDVITIWNFLPLFRCFGYGTIYLVTMKVVYMLVLTSWSLVYAVHSAMSPAPWNTCDDYDGNSTTKFCMVKRKNTSVFQNCLEAQSMYGGDCGMKTASRCFFEVQIGNYVTSAVWPYCTPHYKENIALWCIAFALFVLTLKRKFLRIGVKLALGYVGLGTFVLVCIALGTGGTWFSSSVSLGWASIYSMDWTVLDAQWCVVLRKAFLAVGAGCGMASGWTSGAEFRSPACMTAVAAPLLAVLASLMLSLVTHSGIKTMSFYHGDEENIVELGNNFFFTPFASMTETLSYFDEYNLSGFIWFSVTFVCMFVNTWLLFSYLKDYLINNLTFARRHHKSSSMSLVVSLVLLSYPCFCSDLTPALLDAAETVQIFTSLIFSITIYWIYGYYNHSVDIIFMIGVKTSYFWKFCWVLNPVFICFILVTKCTYLALSEHGENSHEIESLGTTVDFLLYIVLLGIYALILLFPLVVQLLIYIANGDWKGLFTPCGDWGPKDDILFKSRKMFVPEIMTTEFLYRQVKKHGYSKRKNVNVKKELSIESEASHCLQPTEWSVLTSN